MPNVILLFDIVSSILGLYKLTEKMHRCVDYLVFLRKNLHLKNNLLQERFQKLAGHRPHLAMVFTELEGYSVLSYFEFVDATETILSLLANVSFDPVWLDCFFALMVDEGAT